MKAIVEDLTSAESDRSQLLTDCLNKFSLFETSVEMNIKYDTQQFQKVLDDLHQLQQEQQSDESGDSSGFFTHKLQLDNAGQYRYEEWKEKTSMVLSHADPVRMKLEEELTEFVDRVWKDELKFNGGEEEKKELDRFKVMMNEEDGRSCFLSVMNFKKSKNEVVFESSSSFENFSILVKVLLENFELNPDMKNSL